MNVESQQLLPFLFFAILSLAFVLGILAIRWKRKVTEMEQTVQQEQTRFQQRASTLERTIKLLQEQEQRVQLTLASAQAGTYDYVVADHRTYWDARSKEIFGLETDGGWVEPELWDRMLHPEDREWAQETVQQAIRDNSTYRMEYRVVLADGQIKHIRAAGYVVCGVEGPIRVSGLHFDITEEKVREERLKQAREVAEQAAKSKSEFLTTMSHEIRTPLNGILGVVELIRDTDLTDRQNRLLDTLADNGEALTQILNDILDISKLDAGKLELFQESFILDDLVQQVLRIFTKQFHDKDLYADAIIDPQVPLAIEADASRLRQVLLNLVGNAVKFTHVGHVRVRVNTDGSQLRFVIEDTGIGIAKDHIDNLFQSFHQADSTITRRYGGTGLGLSLVRYLVNLWGGDVSVESELNKGSRFTFTLPFEPLAERIDWQYDVPGHVYTISRFEELKEAVSSVLRVDVKHLRDSVQDWDRLIGDKPTVLVMDQRLPGGLLGSELSAELCSQFPNLKVILLGFLNHLPKTLSPTENFQVLPKPILVSELQLAVAQLTRGMKPNQTIKSPIKRMDLSHYKVLVAEDNMVNQQVIKGLLKRYGIKPVMAQNGAEAVEVVSEQEFDLILMDCEMPVMDGYLASRLITERPNPPPIVAVSAHAMAEHRQMALQSGMSDYLTKPIRIPELENMLSRFLKH